MTNIDSQRDCPNLAKNQVAVCVKLGEFIFKSRQFCYESIFTVSYIKIRGINKKRFVEPK